MKIKDISRATSRMLLYNMKIIFGGKFIWFLIIGFLLFGFLMFQTAYQGVLPSNKIIYDSMIMSALLLVFYPATFGIQNDADNKILELLFSIPNYMYKVWLLRLLMIYIEIFFILVIYSFIARFMLYPINPWIMASYMMLPVLFYGNLAFFISTWVKNGNATAVIIIVIFFLFTIIVASTGQNVMYNVLLNPFSQNDYMHPAIWSNILFKNRMFLIISSVVLMMLGLLNLQRREKFL